PSREPALIPQLTLEIAAIERLHGMPERRRVDALDVDHLVLHRPLDRRRERVQRLRWLLTVAREVRGDVDRLAERDEDAPAEPSTGRETESDRHDREASRSVRLVTERDPGRARLDRLQVRLRRGNPFGVDGDEQASVER